MIDAAYIVLGLFGLLFGTNMVIHAATDIARHYALSELFVGLAILSIGSDLPELAVVINAGIRNAHGMQTSGVVIGSSIGSAFGQIGLVLGIAGLAGYLTVAKRYVYRHGTVLLGSLFLLAFAGWDGVISPLDGLMLLAAFAIYFIRLLLEERGRERPLAHQRRYRPHSWLLLVFGMVIVIICSDLTVRGVTHIAEALGVAQTLISILVIGPGTSLPELTISLGALIKKKHGMSIGNIIGSNIFDTLVPIGIAATIAPLRFDQNLLWFDLPALFVLSFLVLVFFVRRKGLQKSEAIILLVYYAAYALLTIFRFQVQH